MNSPAGERRARFAIPVLLLAAGAACFAIAYQRLWSYLTDDVFISVRYAQHLATGAGLVYNVGERVEGYTNLLWTLLIAPGIAIGAGIVPWIKIMNAAWAIVAALLTVRLATTLSRATLDPVAPGEDPRGLRPAAWWPVLPGALLLASSPFVMSAAEGLETMMFAALLLFVVLTTIEARDSEHLPRAAIALVLLGLTRPGGWAYLPWVLLTARLAGRSWSWVLRCAAWAIAGFAAREAFRWFYYGDLLPNTLYAKSGGSGFLIDRGWSRLVAFLGSLGGFVWFGMLLPLARRRSRGIAIAILAAIGIRVAFHLWSGGPWMARGRFLIPVLPLMLVLLVWGVMLTVRRPAWRAAVLALVSVLVLFPGWREHAAQEAGALQYGRNLRAAHQRLGADIARSTTPDAVMAMDDAGLGPLVAARTNVDMLGLNDRHIARLPGEFGVKFDPQYVLDRNPDVIVLMSRRAPPITRADLFVAGQQKLFDDPLFQRQFQFAREYEFQADYRLLLYVRKDSKKVDPALSGSEGGSAAPEPGGDGGR